MTRHAETIPFLQFEFLRQSGVGGICFSDPVDVIEAVHVEEVVPALIAVQQAVSAGYYAAGYLSYEAAPALDPALVVRTGALWPLVWFGIFHQPVTMNSLLQNKGPDDRICDNSGARHCPGTADRPNINDAMITSHSHKSEWTSKWVRDWQATTTRLEYDAAMDRIREAIQDGETYQVNYTVRLKAEFRGDDFAYYRRMTQMQEANYCAYLNMGRYRVLSASPELFFHWDGTTLTTRPMKGTMKRGRWLEEDEQFASWLALSEKDRAENLMIVDLLRNDLGRIAIPGSVKVPDLFEIERYPTLLQMTSTVTAKTKPGLQLADIFQAIFPCGSVTGAPKVNTMRWVAELEKQPREVYCGAIGYMMPQGEAIFNVPIRTVMIDTQQGTAEYGVGSGITWDSEDEREYQELMLKSSFLMKHPVSFSLLESIRLEAGRYILLARHLTRLKDSAEYFNFGILEHHWKAIEQGLQDYALEHPFEVQKIRLLVQKNGSFQIEGTPIPEPWRFKTISFKNRGPVQIVVLARTPIDKNNRFLYHKTTHREVYDVHRPSHPDVFDCLLWNADLEVTEFTTGNLVAQIDGRLWTPARESGLLAGTLRQEVLETGRVQERILKVEELYRASKLWYINSVRGWIPVRLTLF